MKREDLKVLYFMTGLGMGGIERFVEDIVNNAKQVDITIISFGKKEDLLAKKFKKGSHNICARMGVFF